MVVELHMNVKHFGALFRTGLLFPTLWSIAAERKTAYLVRCSSSLPVIASFPDPKKSRGEFKLG